MRRAGDDLRPPVRPGDAAGRPAEAAARLELLVAELESTDLRPAARVDALFRALVAEAFRLAPGELAEVSAAVAERARCLSARGEALLEAHWAGLVASGRAPVGAFPYAAHYARLVGWERAVVRRVLGREPRRAVVAGAGPLPLTALVLARLVPGLAVTCLDRDVAAVAAGARVARSVGADPRRVSFAVGDAAEHDYRDADLVLVAALVGTDDGAKSAVLSRAAGTAAATAVLAARTVPDDGRRLLYRRIGPAAVPAALCVQGEHHPPPGVVNSLLVLTRPRDPRPPR
ncbi:MAG: nicotianamine synthase family protein [Kineosporiaceae bacterium]